MAMLKKAVVVEARLRTRSVRELTLRMVEPEELGHRAGQYIILRALGEDGTRQKRSYSVSSAPSRDGTFSITVKLISGGTASSFVGRLRPGDEVRFTGPWGKFTLPAKLDRPLAFVATGTGISPTLPLALEALDRRTPHPILLLWGLRCEEDIFLRRELERLENQYDSFRALISLSRPGPSWQGPRGRVTTLIPQIIAEPTSWRVYLSGNGSMVREVEAYLLLRGAHPSQVHKEIFFNPIQEGSHNGGGP